MRGRTGTAEGALTSWYLLRALTSRMSDLLLWTPLLNTLAIAMTTVTGSLVASASRWRGSSTVPISPAEKGFSTLLIIAVYAALTDLRAGVGTIFKTMPSGDSRDGWKRWACRPPDWMAYGCFRIVVIMILHYTAGYSDRRQRPETHGQPDGRVRPDAWRFTHNVIAFKIIIPLVRPALLSAALLIFADCIGEFALPYILGLPVHFDTLSTGLYRAIGTRQSGVAAVIATVIMLMGMLT